MGIKLNAVWTMVTFGEGRQEIFKILIDVIHSQDFIFLRSNTILCLESILTSNLFAATVRELKVYVKQPIDEKCSRNFSQYCYWVLWNCAQNMSYTDFHRAWNSPSSTEAESPTDD